MIRDSRYYAKRDAIWKLKSPDNHSKVPYVGVEIEFISMEYEEDIVDAFIEADLEQYVNLTKDGSVKSDNDCDGTCYYDSCECHYCGGDICDSAEECHGEHDCNCECNCPSYGHELRVLAKQSEIKAIIVRVCEVLNKLQAEVNLSCGLHVHLDMRHRDADKAYSNLVTVQDLMYAMVSPKRRVNSFAKPNKFRSLKKQVNAAGRYLGVNPHSLERHKTLEVRLHSGTVCPVKINNWIELLIRVVELDKKIRKAPFDRLMNKLDLPQKTVKYINRRIERFAA